MIACLISIILIISSCSGDRKIYPENKKNGTTITKTDDKNSSDIINDILISDADASSSIPMLEGCDSGWTKIRGGGPNAYYFCILPEPQTERYGQYLDIPHASINGSNIEKIYDYSSVCAEMGADWCTVQELMAAYKLGYINLSAQDVSYLYGEQCQSATTFTGTSTFAKFPSKFCMEKEAAGGEVCSGSYFFTKFNDNYYEGCENAHENRTFYGWEDNSYSWVNVNVFCCYR